MTRLILTAVFTALAIPLPGGAAPGGGGPPELSTAAFAAPPQISTTAPSAAEQPRHAREIMSALKHLSALLARSSRVDQRELDGTAADIIRLDDRLKLLLGPDLLRELEEEDLRLRSKTLSDRAKEELAAARSAVILYYGDLEGKYPAAPAELIPAYLPAMPELELPGHARTSAVEVTDYEGADIRAAVTDAGGWLYFAGPKSPYFGMLALNCSHKDDTGLELYNY